MNALDPAAVAYLCGLKQSGVQLGLDRMRALVSALGNPHEGYPVIHVAGTNGKGSVAAMVESIFRRAGWRTGLYTSPHLVRLGERIQVDREPLGSLELTALVHEMRGIVEGRVAIDGPEARPSYFEFMTALGLLHFARSQCDIAIVEVGMGGRRDATNIVNPEVSVITSIGFDHTEFLGDTIEAIAGEKAGIIKRSRPVVIGRLPAEAERVIRSVAEAQAAQVVSVRDEFGDDLAAYPRPGMEGDHQRVNAATATLVARQFDAVWRAGDVQIADALQHVDWPARWQRLMVGGRLLIVDASHNRDGAAVLDENLRALVQETGRKPVVAIGVLGAARARPLLAAACRHAAELRLLVPHQQRACSQDELQSLVPDSFSGRIQRSSVDALFATAEVYLPDVPVDVPVVVTGSIYLAGEVLAAIEPSRGPLEDELQDF